MQLPPKKFPSASSFFPVTRPEQLLDLSNERRNRHRGRISFYFSLTSLLTILGNEITRIILPVTSDNLFSAVFHAEGKKCYGTRLIESSGYRTGHPSSHTLAILLSPVHRSKENLWLSQRRLLGDSVTIRVFLNVLRILFSS